MTLASVSHFRDDDWNPAQRRRTELCLLDSLTCFSVGQDLDHFAPHAQVVDRLFGQRESALRAAYIYGQAANALDFDDTLIGHPGAPIVGAVLAVAAQERLSSDAVLRGIAAGYQAHWLLAASALPSHERGALIRSVGVWDTVAAGMGIGVALGMDDAELAQMFGVATSHSLLPYTGKWYERPVPGVKNNLGWVAAGAVIASELARTGQTGVTRPLEGDTGMWAMAGSDQWQMAPELFLKPAVLRVGFKRYPACWHLQQYLTTMSTVLMQMPPNASIAEVVVRGPQDMAKFCDPQITSSADIAFSLPACLSLMISGVEPGPEWDGFALDAVELQHRHRVRFESSDTPALEVRTGSGTVELPVEVSDRLDPAAWGLNESELLEKHARFVKPHLQNDFSPAGFVSGSSLTK